MAENSQHVANVGSGPVVQLIGDGNAVTLLLSIAA